MARNPNQEKGIPYFPLNSNHISHDKIKLLMAEFDTAGFWIYHCLLSEIYSKNGYYLNTKDRDNILLFASDVCKRQVSLVDEVINGCVRRGLFDKSVFDVFGVLTNDRIQENYLAATERRKLPRELIKEYLLINPAFFKNVNIIEINVNINGKNVLHPDTEKSRVKESRVKESNTAHPREDGFLEKKSTSGKQPEKKHPPRSAPPPSSVVLPWDTDRFKQAWDRWKKYKMDQHRFKYKSTDSEQEALNSLKKDAGGNEADAIEFIRFSIGQGWQGIFPNKKASARSSAQVIIHGQQNF